MRVLLWHGYLLGGTGSNVYTQALAREWSRAGHEVTVVCQERHPEQYELGGASVVRPELPGRLLPVFVLDRYEGLEPVLLQDMSVRERAGYVEANADALRGLPDRVKAHGSELEYSLRGRPELEAAARDALTGAEATFVGSRHIREVLADVLGHVDRVVEVPPGVDVDEFVLQERGAALAELLEETRRDPPNHGNANERLPDEGNAERLAAFFDRDEPTVVYVGKLIENKGVQLLLEAARELQARTVVVGFGDYRARLEAQADTRTLFTGPLEHRHLVHLLPLADAAVVPSIFPEAFGMVAAEAAAAGCPPLVARHSGLAEIAAGLESEYPEALRHLAAFESGSADDLRRKLGELLALSPADREALRAAARRAVEARWSWTSVAERLLA